MKVLAINGSPRKKTAQNIFKMFQEQFAHENVEDFEILHLSDYDIPHCKACLVCVEKGEQKCPHYSNYGSILEKIRESDLLLFSSPVYVNNVSGYVKNLFDHLAFLLHRPEFFHKEAIIVVTTLGSGLRKVHNYLYETIHSWGYTIRFSLKIKAKALENNELFKKKIEDSIKTQITSIIHDDRNKKSKITAKDMITFQVFKILVNITKDSSPADYEYWKKRNWLESDYYISQKLNPFKNVLAKTVSVMMKRQIKKNKMKKKIKIRY